MSISGRGPVIMATLVAVACAAACSAPPRADRLLRDHLPIADFPVATQSILPVGETTGDLLLDGWQSLGIGAEQGELWVEAPRAGLRFYAAAPGPSKLVFEARPFSAPGTPGQLVSVSLNDQDIGIRQLPPGWAGYEVALPAEHLRPGWNRLALSFRHVMQPSDYLPDSNDRRHLAAVFRRLAIDSHGRPAWTDGPAAVHGGGDPAGGALHMPTDSFFDAYVAAGPTARLVGEIGVEFRDPQEAGTISAAIEIADAPGETRRLFEHTFRDAPRTLPQIDMPLPSRAAGPVKLRLLVWGARNGTVLWNRFGLADPTENEARGIPGELRRPPVSGRLGRPDVVVILLDAARADAFEDAALAPNVAAMAAGGTRFTSAWAPSAWTGQSVPALLTGRYPDAIGMETWNSRIPETVTAFPELLLEAGYHTVVWSQHTVYRGNRTLRRGFEEATHALDDRDRLPTAEELFEADRPTLALVHLLPPHGGYNPPEPFIGSLSSWYEGDFGVSAANLSRFARELEDPAAGDEIRRYARARYDENVRYADHLVGRLVEMLRDADRFEEALVVVLSDHGEAFLEHGRFGHTADLYEETLRVPLVVKWPRSTSGFASDVRRPVSLVDIAPTLTDGLGIDDERAAVQGRSLLPLAFDAAPVAAAVAAADPGAAPSIEPTLCRPVFAYTRGATLPEHRPRQQWSARFGSLKLIYEPWPNGPRERLSGPATVELYDLEADPGERQNLIGRGGFLEAFLLQELLLLRHRNAALLLADAGGELSEALDPETLRNLRALGYIR